MTDLHREIEKLIKRVQALEDKSYSELARKAGRTKTKAKSDAARLNGKKGGRPRKYE